MVKFQLHLDTSVPEAKALYQKEEYMLTVGPEQKIPLNSHRLSLDDITLFFNPVNHQLIAIEAYTNSKYWKYQQLPKLATEIRASISCKETFDEHGIARSRKSSVNYIYSEETSSLLVKLGEGLIEYRARCLSCVVCSLGSDGELLELWIEGVN